MDNETTPEDQRNERLRAEIKLAGRAGTETRFNNEFEAWAKAHAVDDAAKQALRAVAWYFYAAGRDGSLHEFSHALGGLARYAQAQQTTERY